MTIIEFYDKAAIENIASALMCEPEKVVLVGDKKTRQGDKIAAMYQRVLSKKGIKTQIFFKSVTKTNLQIIVDELSRIVEEDSKCIFDVTGGEEMYLVAVGILMKLYEGRVQCQRFNLKSETLCDCDADGNVSATKNFDLSVEDNISIYGGELITAPERFFFTYPWDFSDDFVNDIRAMWDICRKNPRLWNAHIGTIDFVCDIFKSADPLTVKFNKERASAIFRQKGVKYVCATWIIEELQRYGLLKSVVRGDDVTYSFKNEQVKRCLTVAGQVLELAVAINLRVLNDKDGLPLYHDIKVGAVIDWDNSEEEGGIQTLNEIDVMAMKGVIPIFISCKNGDFDVNELYKLNTVAERFGNKYAKKVLVATEADKMGEKAENIRERANEMGIRLIWNVDEMSDTEFARLLRSLWCN